MWGSATSSDHPGQPGAGGTAFAAALLALGVLVAIPGPAAGRVFLTVEEALELAFPDCSIERDTVYLTDAETERIADEAGSRPESAIAHPYRAVCDGEPGGTAYFDVHRVRTLPETVMVVVDPDGAVERVELLAFQEPPDYIPRDAWYDQFDERQLDDDLALKRGIRPVTGATLTARATTEAVRRTLALHELLARREAAEKSETSGGGSG